MSCWKCLLGGVVWAFVVSWGPVLPAQVSESEQVYLKEPADEPPPALVRRQKIQGKYEGGEIRLEREVAILSDDTLVSDGTYVEYYPGGEKFCEGTYESGVITGQWSYWHPNGQLCKKLTFKQGRPVGSFQVFRADGTLEAVQSYKDGVRDGEWSSYFEDGKTPKFQSKIVDGKIEGERTLYYPDGTVKQKATFAGGALNGVVEEFDETGKKIAEATFENGQRGAVKRFE